jgi:hypothetical protein
MTNGSSLSAAMAGILLVAGCSNVNVRSDWDHSVDFSRFETFAFLDDESSTINRLIDGRIRRALVEDLTSKGLQQVGSTDGADLAIGFQVATENRRSYRTVSSGWSARGYRHHRQGWHHGPGMTTVTTTTRARVYTVGAVVVAIFDGENKELIWEGSGSRRLASSGATQSEAGIQDAVGRIMRGFPPSN